MWDRYDPRDDDRDRNGSWDRSFGSRSGARQRTTERGAHTEIQELAGHRELGMTQRYMHLSPAALDSAIRLLDQPLTVQSFGDILETGRVSEGKING